MVERATFVEPAGRLLFDFDLDSGSIHAYLTAEGVDLYRPDRVTFTIDNSRPTSVGLPRDLRTRKETS